MEVGIYLRWIHTGFYSGCFQKWGFEPQWIWKICFQEAQRIENVNVIMITIIVSKTRWWWPYIGWLLVGALNTDITADRPHPPPSSGDIIIDIIITHRRCHYDQANFLFCFSPFKGIHKDSGENDELRMSISFRISKCHGQFQIFVKLPSSRKHLYF